jgi:hypothetical protein
MHNILFIGRASVFVTPCFLLPTYSQPACGVVVSK